MNIAGVILTLLLLVIGYYWYTSTVHFTKIQDYEDGTQTQMTYHKEKNAFFGKKTEGPITE